MADTAPTTAATLPTPEILEKKSPAEAKAEGALAKALTTPLPHDRLKSRRFWAGILAFTLIFCGAMAVFIYSGSLLKANQFLDQEYALYFTITAAVVLLFCMGLLSFSQFLELAKLKYLGAKEYLGGGNKKKTP